ncbi:MAG: hypothetical protein CME84_00615 [Henriciella sp.]|jgi:hypothetical protein|uniref:hypothetical protein n=1 Tax=Henriciella sp. TaxID=1968823 RepID=UPI000C0CCFEB|nr:hypothetical protein [Henriciella sp.]MAN72578.1 hypothetical protein [Henriciella sp.]MBF33116.1 hypothetical protein [Hyphomonadaceae bacterium]PHR82977.1 MAG: hypothetical protein COA64_00905 [Henriciella sp.]|tara:strand:- start:19049 stop:19594 length:546 start_codon:yes stop_codon:yes gene_type:complete
MRGHFKVIGLLAAAAMMAAPALADGYANRPVNRGPAPLQAHAEPVPPEPGCYLVGPDTWSCPPLPQTVETHTVRERVSAAACCYSRPAPRPVQVRYTPRPAPAPRSVSIDTSGFDGGVGSGVTGGYYGGGGGGYVYVRSSASANAFASAAASLTFRGGFHGGGGGKHHGGGGGGCGKCGGH